MGKRSDFERVEKDFYRTIDPRAVAALLPHLDPQTHFCEPCAGAGDLVKQLNYAGHRCAEAWDIEPQGTVENLIIQWRDATTYNDTIGECFITNPPWTRAILHAMIENFMSAEKPAWLLFDSDWAFTKQSKPYMNAFCTDIVAVGRLIWIPGTKVSGKDNCSWYRFSPYKAIEDNFTKFHGR